MQKEDEEMNVGDRVKFQFGGEEKEGVVFKIFPKKVYLKADFTHHPAKLMIRKLAEVEGGGPTPKPKKKKEKAQKREEKKNEQEKE